MYFNDSNYSLGEDDDLIFKQNVTSSIELDARKQSIVVNEINDSYSLENPPSDELRSVHSDSEEEVVQEARGKDILALLQSLQNKLMEWMYKRRLGMERFGGKICPKALKKFERNREESYSWRALYNGDMQYQVSGPYSDGQFVVELRTRSCACRKWDLTGFPCPHALASIRD
ncbi:Uncharacterized protein Adt_13933 [Abeliophyllum distichum]|uniref:SWIM-type domain-containing protein n=1 Tax=Abeliophyllum distichum TaxID=126358 RepID=A0ABD1TY91_9LAMI